MLATFFERYGFRRRLGATALAAASVLVTTSGWAADTGTQRLRCSNPSSGANWLITIDFDHARVDLQPAKITGKWISWPDPKQGYFDLERATGKLQFRNPSSTGGYFLYYICQPE